MGVYIKDMQLPKEGAVEVFIRDDGTVQQTGQSCRIGATDYYTPYVGDTPIIYKAIPIPKHGGLINRDTLNYTMLYKENWMSGTGVEAPAVWKKDIEDAPVIIPASNEE